MSATGRSTPAAPTDVVAHSKAEDACRSEEPLKSKSINGLSAIFAENASSSQSDGSCMAFQNLSRTPPSMTAKRKRLMLRDKLTNFHFAKMDSRNRRMDQRAAEAR